MHYASNWDAESWTQITKVAAPTKNAALSNKVLQIDIIHLSWMLHFSDYKLIDLFNIMSDPIFKCWLIHFPSDNKMIVVMRLIYIPMYHVNSLCFALIIYFISMMDVTYICCPA